MLPFAFLGPLGGPEVLVLLVVGVLLFGRKLPDVGRSLGKTIVEFKKGFNGLEDEISGGGSAPKAAIEPEAVRPPQRVTAPAPKFDDSPATAGSLPPTV